MLLPRLVLVGSLPLLVALAACQAKTTAPTPTADAKAAKAGPASEAKVETVPAGPAPGSSADGGPTQAEVTAAEAKAAGVSQGPVASLQNDPEKALGAHLVDPGWFRKTMFGDAAKVLDTKRSQADDQGRFSSLMRFEVPDMTLEGCADHLQAAVKADVPEIAREAKPDGRVYLSGATDRYKITFVCGQNEGKTIAFVSYEWT